ncbi:hypothetical protein HOR75_gp29 [Shewanella phage SppYZU05]|uniref:HD domain-containing protein n=1 Tax=Shewanella phage SppYZU05 TaxID=1970795 RepID=A0A1W6JTL5_9CAUD|nr:hypothetical protein HOR75_gp29 [Shewanella phage SppYZU05]ARM70555.1 hypothetical protein SppYZU05_29 [Shewanella phage SppYZU05]
MSLIQVGFTPAEAKGLTNGDEIYHVVKKTRYTVFGHGRMQVAGEWQDAVVYHGDHSGYYARAYTDFHNFIYESDAAPYEAQQRDLAAKRMNDTIAAGISYKAADVRISIGNQPIQLGGMMDANEMIRISRKVTEEQSLAPFIPADDVLAALRSGGVERYHAQPDVPAQSTAEHMWGVAILMMKFYGRDLSTKLLAAALTHDCGEVGIGDVPSPTKRASPEVKETFDRLEEEMLIQLGVNWVGTLSEEETIALKICDVLEGLHYVTRKLHVPNMRVAKAWAEYAATLPLNVAQKKFVLACLNHEEPVLIDRSPFAVKPQGV